MVSLCLQLKKKAKKSVERASKQPRRDEVCAKVAAAKEMCVYLLPALQRFLLELSVLSVQLIEIRHNRVR